MRGQNQPTTTAVNKKKQDSNQPFTCSIDHKLFPRRGAPETEDGYTIAKALREDTSEIVTLKGRYGPVVEGQLLKVVKYAWRHDSRYGQFCQVWSVSHEDPITREAVVHYLKNLPGVGERLSEAIVDDLGPNCLSKIDKDPQLLLQVKVSGRGVNPQKLEEVLQKWDELRAERKNMLYFSSIGIGDATGKKIAKVFPGQQLQQKIADDPYCICQVPGVGFKIADRVALKMGVATDDPRRAAAGVEYLLQEAEKDGHICLPREEIFKKAPWLLKRGSQQPSTKIIEQGLEKMIADGRLWREEEEDGIERIYTTEHYMIESRLYEKLEKRLEDIPDEPPIGGLPYREDDIVTEEQWGAVKNGMTEKLSILVGSAGTGKTTALRSLLDELDRHQTSYLCLAPTGKAAKRMNESTGREAATIHRALGFDGLRAPHSFRGSVEEPLTQDVIIVDEASMLDMRIAERLFSHVRDDARVVLVGDPHQLPAVGAGSVLHDLVESERVPTTKLTQIFRQAEGSLLVVNANRIRQGQEPYWSAKEAEKALGHKIRADWEFIETEDPHEALSRTLELSKKLPAEMGISPEQIMVTAPMKTGDVGVHRLNQSLQRQRNPHGRQIRDGEQPLRVDDMVMNTLNRYGQGDNSPDIMNGDQGKIVDYDETKKTVYVDFGFEREIVFSHDQIDNLIPAYAATTHKLQGSEAPAIIAPLLGNNKTHKLLTRNMLYTGWTRGKEKCTVIGSKEQIKQAITKDGSKRNTTLDLRVGRIMPRLKMRWERAARMWANSPEDILYG